MTNTRWTALLAILWLIAFDLAAAEIQIRHDGLALNGRLFQPEERGLSNGVLLIVHDTLTSNDADGIAGLQSHLLHHGLASLAINLTLGVDDRRGPYDCARPHFHRHQDAVGEIAAWMDWLGRSAPGGVTLVGYGRGANQAAQYAIKHADERLQGLVMAAPMLFDRARIASAYQSRSQFPLAPITRHARNLMIKRKSRELLYRIEFLSCTQSDVSAGSVLSYYAEDRNQHTPHLLPAIAKPVLVVAAGYDPQVDQLIQEVGPLADGEHLQLQMVEASDARFGGSNAEQLANAIIRFMARGETASVTAASLVD